MTQGAQGLSPLATQEETAASTTVLYRVGTECADLASAVDSLQDHLSVLIFSGRDNVPPGTITALQDVDRIRQTLEALARTLCALSPTMTGRQVAVQELQEAIGLPSVAARLIPGRSAE